MTLAVVWALSHFHYYLYGHKVTVITDHTAVKAALDSPNPSGHHARWWTRVFGQGIRKCPLFTELEKENVAADVLVEYHFEISSTLNFTPCNNIDSSEFYSEQRKDPSVAAMFDYLEKNHLPRDTKQARVISAKAPSYSVLDGTLYFINGKKRKCQLAGIPQKLRNQLQVMEQYHGGPLGGHYSGNGLYYVLSSLWYWDGVYTGALNVCRSCPQCAIVSGGERSGKQPYIHPIPVQWPFQILGLAIMDLPCSHRTGQ